MKFTKMHGLGNDYIYVNELPENPEALSIKISHRHFGIGSDGLILILPSENADFQMRIFNADGSEAKMCGNGIRCVGKYVYDKGLTSSKTVNIDTLSGIKVLTLFTDENNKVEKVSVDMGKGIVSPELAVEVSGTYPEIAACEGNKTTVTGSAVSVGNPHFVVFVNDAEAVPLADVGPKTEKHAAFPGGVNTEYVSVVEKNHLRMRVWERGSGITMACGTGACATCAAAVTKGICEYNKPIFVDLDGGTLEITVADDMSITMTGPAATVFEGEIEV